MHIMLRNTGEVGPVPVHKLFILRHCGVVERMWIQTLAHLRWTAKLVVLSFHVVQP